MAATGTWKWYASAFLKAFNKEIDYDSDTIKLALTTSSYTPNQATHDYFNDVTNEITNAAGSAYVAGGATLASKTIALSTLVLNLDAADVTWTTASFTYRTLVLYDATPGTAATNPLIGYCTLSADETVSAGTATIQFDATGILSVTPS